MGGTVEDRTRKTYHRDRDTLDTIFNYFPLTHNIDICQKKYISRLVSGRILVGQHKSGRKAE